MLSSHTPRLRQQIKPPGHQANELRATRNQHRVGSHHDKRSGGLPHGSGGSHSLTERPTWKTSLSCCPLTGTRSATGVRMSLVLFPIVLKPPFSGTACLACAFAAAANVGTLSLVVTASTTWWFRAQGAGAGQMNVNTPRRIFRTLRIVGGLPTALMQRGYRFSTALCYK